MSGRAIVNLEDGRTVRGYRKTLRRNRRRPLIERVHEANHRCRRRFPSKWVHDVRLGFFLPHTLQPFVASGPHGGNVNVSHGFVQVMGGSTEECCITAEKFLVDVAKGKPAFTAIASVTSSRFPEKHYSRWLSVVNGALVVCAACLVEPKIYEV